MAKSGYNTNLASEYYVLSMLYRKGIEAYLTLGNKKSVDILVRVGRRQLTIDVKGIAGTTLWPMDNFVQKAGTHFVVLVTYLRRIEDHNAVPEVYVVPAGKVSGLLYRNPKGTRKGIRVATIRRYPHLYRDRWDLLS